MVYEIKHTITTFLPLPLRHNFPSIPHVHSFFSLNSIPPKSSHSVHFPITFDMTRKVVNRSGLVCSCPFIRNGWIKLEKKEEHITRTRIIVKWKWVSEWVNGMNVVYISHFPRLLSLVLIFISSFPSFLLIPLKKLIVRLGMGGRQMTFYLLKCRYGLCVNM